MALSFQQLITPVTKEEALTQTLDDLAALGFNSTSWQEGSVQYTFVQLIAELRSDFSLTVKAYAEGGLPGFSTGTLLDFLGKYMFKTERVPATPTVGVFRLTSAAGSPIHNWDAEEIQVADADVGESANVFVVINPGSINPGETIDVQVQAVNPGNSGNLGNDIPLFLWTPLVGVTATNPPIDTTSTWIQFPGQDQESDDRYTERFLGRWDRLTYGNTDGAYSAWAFEALDVLTRVTVITEPEGVVRLVGATSTGGLTAGQITTIEEYINGITDGVGRRPINDVFNGESATQLTTPPLDVNVLVLGNFQSGIVTQTENALIKLLGGIPIGGRQISTGNQGYVLLADLYEAVTTIDGVVNVTFPNVNADIPLGNTDIYTPTINVNVTVL